MKKLPLVLIIVFIIAAFAAADYYLNNLSPEVSVPEQPEVIKDTPDIIPFSDSAFRLNSEIIGYKVEETKTKLKENCQHLLRKNHLDLVIGNTISAFGKNENTIFLVTDKKITTKKGSKEDLAYDILNSINE